MAEEAGNTLDLLVVGAGPTGIAIGARARQAGLEVLLVDRGPLAAALVGFPVYMGFFTTRDLMEIAGLETRLYRRQVLTVTGEITTDIFDVGIVTSLLAEWGDAGPADAAEGDAGVLGRFAESQQRLGAAYAALLVSELEQLGAVCSLPSVSEQARSEARAALSDLVLRSRALVEAPNDARLDALEAGLASGGLCAAAGKLALAGWRVS